MRPCPVIGCDKPYYSRNGGHHVHTPEERFWSKVDKNGPNGCWIWTCALGRRGYGRFAWSHSDFRQAHRVAYELVVGPIPEGLHIDHLCRVHNCVNPAHLEPVTLAENNRRAALATMPTHCPRGHQYTPDNTRYSSRGDGTAARRRVCRTCDIEAKRRARANTRSISPQSQLVTRPTREARSVDPSLEPTGLGGTFAKWRVQ